jgi:hypothetical protein
MNAARDVGRMICRWGIVACGTLIVAQVIPIFVLPAVALAMEGAPRVITAYAGCGLVVSALMFCRVWERLFIIGLFVGVAAILVSRIPALVRA